MLNNELEESSEKEGVKSYEVGKWYHFMFVGEYFLKCSNFDSTYFYYDEGYSFNYHQIRCYKGQKHSLSNKPLREVSLKEMQEYLPDGHVDKIVKNTIPEYVECTCSLNKGFTIGKIYTWENPIDDEGVKRTISLLSGGLWKFKPSTKEAYNRQQRDLEIWNAKIEKSKGEWIPKVGDWAICTVDYNHIWYKGRVWQIGKVKEYSQNDLKCSPIENGEILYQSLLFKSRGFRKAEPHEIPKQNIENTHVHLHNPQTGAGGCGHRIEIDFSMPIKEMKLSELKYVYEQFHKSKTKKPTIQINIQEESKIQIKFKKPIKI